MFSLISTKVLKNIHSVMGLVHNNFQKTNDGQRFATGKFDNFLIIKPNSPLVPNILLCLQTPDSPKPGKINARAAAVETWRAASPVTATVGAGLAPALNENDTRADFASPLRCPCKP
jgi:hypothetical protein